MKKIYRHRLALLLGLLIALVFFYLGVNKWIETQQSVATAPPSIVRAKEPVQIKEETDTVTPEAEEIEEETGEVTVDLPPPGAVQTVATTESPQTQQQETQQTPTQNQPKEEEPKKPADQNQDKKPADAGKAPDTKKEQVIQEEPKIIIRKAEKEFILQIGAFRERNNARKLSKEAQGKGFESFVIEEEGLFKVRVRVLAGSAREAVKNVRSSYRGAFIVK